ncbi:MAG: undecaprenyldiphospho-muramoylpentapeptide beta-N-acetylglucosaminyltransferase [Clostridia bacterium]|nr:undecaprenyldiphospho-muramoylpentapeptide beta-N-acetylglucosaminyltransferase [Clostridia bacterium]
MKVLFSCGGTGGHINPAIAIANTLKERYPDFECLFVGAEGGMEAGLVPKAGYNIEFVKVRGFKRKLSLANVDAAIKAVTSVFAAKKIIKRFKPQVVVGTGGYASWAAVKAAASLGVPTLIHEQNAYPGVTTRKLSAYANRVCISFEESCKFFDDSVKEKLVLTGNPLKPEVLKADRSIARKELGLTDEVYILSFGGSLGAEKVNEYVFDMLESYVKNNTSVRAIHATGKRGNAKYGEIAAQKGINKAKNIEVREYIYDMHRQLAASDLVICRAGAITIAENCCMGKPSILIPSPNVTDNHQYKNAKVLSDAGAALLLEESKTDGAILTAAVKDLVESPEKRQAMSAAAYALAKGGAADEICTLIERMVKQ